MSKTQFEETEMLQLFREICVGVQVLHTYRGQGGARIQYESNQPMSHEEESRQDQGLLSGNHQEQSTGGVASEGTGEIVPWAHRDIKPGNVLIADDGQTAVLMDFGSMCQARIHIENRQEALAQQDIAAEHCTMPYRAPELFDVKTGTTLDEKVDIWSLGCTLYAMAYGQSPFEMNMDQGGSVALAVLNNQYKFPEGSNKYSDNIKDMIQWMLTTDPSKRPNIHQILNKLNELLDSQVSK
ncbi:hypothetical protein G6F46_005575 [Rhizopus delemar]|uniref:non-specific serine/threonine protein kinase n=2 Tax=Rhizopus TaxID=4842 RepID=A0A9P7CMS0_9FUNG|nr:hypothetical protein G6F55_007022 [Rhizopus delemar]KAG1537365.1 hypothetical protein G6F51_010417 [Rhizopus arrhizus]KAG1491638.1 hypothetical protein G6F54_009873 [Rhizopus delemar]KAG1513825.1 hypothetical protein G6F53_004142 [Rhizopus delemar]KAG1520889.1 hypothetical protein G6F52_007246 [Rhizopus delemar]